MQVDQKKHLFAFGSKVADDVVRKSSEGEKRFQDIFYYLFNWATVGSYKWRFDKGTVSSSYCRSRDVSLGV